MAVFGHLHMPSLLLSGDSDSALAALVRGSDHAKAIAPSECRSGQAPRAPDRGAGAGAASARDTGPDPTSLGPYSARKDAIRRESGSSAISSTNKY
jgi:hypothetical protein